MSNFPSLENKEVGSLILGCDISYCGEKLQRVVLCSGVSRTVRGDTQITFIEKVFFVRQDFPVFGDARRNFAEVLRVRVTGNIVFTRLITHREPQRKPLCKSQWAQKSRLTKLQILVNEIKRAQLK